MLKKLQNVEIGLVSPQSLMKSEYGRRALSLHRWDHRSIPLEGGACADLSSDLSKLIVGRNMLGPISIYDVSPTNRFWESEGNRLIPIKNFTKTGKSYINLSNSIQWYPTDTNMFSTTSHIFELWNVNSDKPVLKLEPSPKNSDASYANHHQNLLDTHLVALINGAMFEVFDLRMSTSVLSISPPPSSRHFKFIHAIRWSPRSKSLITAATNQGIATEWDIRSPTKPTNVFESFSPKTKPYNRNFEFNKPCYGDRNSMLEYSSDGLSLFHFFHNGLHKFDVTSCAKLASLTLAKTEGYVPPELEWSRSFSYPKFCLSTNSQPNVAYLPYENNVRVIDLDKFSEHSKFSERNYCYKPVSSTAFDEERQILYVLAETLDIYSHDAGKMRKNPRPQNAVGRDEETESEDEFDPQSVLDPYEMQVDF